MTARAPHGSLKAACLPLMDGTRTDIEVSEATGASPSYVRTLSQRYDAALKPHRTNPPRNTKGSGSYLCPKCGGGAGVVNSRPEQLGEICTIRRRRHCNACGDRFTTYELTAEVIEALEARLAEAEAIRTIIRQITDRVPTARPRSDR